MSAPDPIRGVPIAAAAAATRREHERIERAAPLVVEWLNAMGDKQTDALPAEAPTHTAGPLIVSDEVIVDGAPDHGIYVVIDGKRHIVAECFGRSGWGHTHPSKLNAHLFAAAPELLAELQAAHKLLQLALKHMGGERQSLFAAESDRLGLGTDGATRYHERAAVLAKATGAAS